MKKLLIIVSFLLVSAVSLAQDSSILNEVAQSPKSQGAFVFTIGRAYQLGWIDAIYGPAMRPRSVRERDTVFSPWLGNRVQIDELHLAYERGYADYSRDP